MRSIYCTSCGSKILYSVNAPNFCTACGESTGLGLKVTSASVETPVQKAPSVKQSESPRYTPLPKKTPLSKRKPAVHLADDETDIDYVPNISKLQYEIDIPRDNVKSFKDIIHEQKERE
jgi:hypothetical protein